MVRVNTWKFINSTLSAVVILVGILLVCSAAIMMYRHVSTKAPTASTTSAPQQPSHSPLEAGQADADTGSEVVEDLSLPPPDPSEAPEVVRQYVLMSFPNWRAKVVEHDDDWRFATVRVTPEDGSVALDVQVVWDQQLGDYAIAQVNVAKQAGKGGAGSKREHQEILDAVAAHPRFSKLPSRILTVQKATSVDAVVVLRSSKGVWRIYLRRSDAGWQIKKARQIE